jgi:hypothetical protein
MSRNDEETERPDADADEASLRKKTRSLLTHELMKAAIPLENRGVGHRLLPGLWGATGSVLISCLEVPDVITLLNSRMLAIVDNGDNAATPALDLSGKALSKYIKEVATASQTIVEAVELALPHLQRERLDDRLPETMLDYTLSVLLKSWGARHLKRAVVEQVALLLQGTPAPAVFMEPEKHMKRAETRKPEAEPVDVRADVEQRFAPQPVAKVDIDRSEKTIRVFLDYKPGGAGSDWCAVIYKTAPDFSTELHTLKGRVADMNGRSSPVVAAVEALKAVSHENLKSNLIIETCHEHVVNGMDEDPAIRKAARHPSEERLWAEFDTLADGRRIRCKLVQENLAESLQGACDMVIKFGVLQAAG